MVGEREPHAPNCRLSASLDRRAFLAVLGAAVTATLAGCSDRAAAGAARRVGAATELSTFAQLTTDLADTPSVGPIPDPHPGSPLVVSKGPSRFKEVALTVDDGSCEACVAGYVAFAERTGIQLTFCPTGFYDSWSRNAERLD